MASETEVVDVVCGRRFDPRLSTDVVDYEGRRYYFCCPVCREAFERDPAAYADRPPPPWPQEEAPSA